MSSEGTRRMLVARFRPLTHYTYREPGVFTAGEHGPASHGRSLAYPPPSTLAGSLASLLVSHNLATVPIGDVLSPGDTVLERVLEDALGEGFRLAAGFFAYRNKREDASGREAIEELGYLVYLPPYY